MCNLWPEPGPVLISQDQGENYMHELVCAGVWHPGRAHLPLAVARQLIAAYSTAAMKMAWGQMEH